MKNETTIENANMLYKVISGSRAYKLNTPESDVDTRGIYIEDNDLHLLGLNGKQVENLSKDDTFYELNRYMHLLSQSNPNIIELLYIDDEFVLHKDPSIQPLLDIRDQLLSKRLMGTFGAYARQQIIKSQGLNKKIRNPMSREKLMVEDFCHILTKGNNKTIPFRKWLAETGFDPARCGLTSIGHGKQMFNLYYNYHREDDREDYKGIYTAGNRGLTLSEVSDYKVREGILIFDIDGYQSYLRQYKDYFAWVEKRNPKRYNKNIENAHDYDGKNMMHCVRLLDIATYIATEGTVKIIPDNRTLLLSIRNGEVPYTDIRKMTEERYNKLPGLYERSSLPDEINMELLHKTVLKIRKENT